VFQSRSIGAVPTATPETSLLYTYFMNGLIIRLAPPRGILIPISQRYAKDSREGPAVWARRHAQSGETLPDRKSTRRVLRSSRELGEVTASAK